MTRRRHRSARYVLDVWRWRRIAARARARRHTTAYSLARAELRAVRLNRP
jgi:hypothetical protein